MSTRPIIFFLPWYAESAVIQALSGQENLLFVKRLRQSNWVIGSDIVNFGAGSEFIGTLKFEHILQELKQNSPTLARHHDFMPFQELYLRTLATSVLDLASAISKLSPSFVFFGYQSSHHLDCLMFELASRTSNIPQIFAFPVGNVYESSAAAPNMILFEQTQGMETRRLVPPFKHLDRYSEEQVGFYVNPKNNNIPILGTNVGYSSDNYVKTVIWVLRNHFLYRVKRFIKFLLGRVKFDKQLDYYDA